MPSTIVYAEERSILEANMPSFAAILGALHAAQADYARGDSAYGDWVGPAPRVTRVAVLGSGFVTRVAWLWTWPEAIYGAPSPGVTWLRNRLASQSSARLSALSSDFSSPQLLPYDPAVNGSATWWTSGDASRTRTRDDPAEGLARLGAIESAVGPDNPDAVAPGVAPPAVAGQLASATDKLIGLLQAAAWVGGIGLAGYAVVEGVRYLEQRRGGTAAEEPG